MRRCRRQARGRPRARWPRHPRAAAPSPPPALQCPRRSPVPPSSRILTRRTKYLGSPSFSTSRAIVKEGGMEADELRSEISMSTLRFIADVVLHNQAVAQRVGLGGSDSQFLSLLGIHGPLTPGRLAELTGLTTGTVTGVIDRLERAGYAR